MTTLTYREAVQAEADDTRHLHQGHAVGDTVHTIHTGSTLWRVTGFAPSEFDGEQASLEQAGGFAHSVTAVSRLVAIP